MNTRRVTYTLVSKQPLRAELTMTTEPNRAFCGKYEKTQRWTDGRYKCDREEGHEGRCGSWSRSGSGRQSFEGHEPCEHQLEGAKDCGCILGDGIDDTIGTKIAQFFSAKVGEEE